MTKVPPAQLTDWQGKDWTPDCGRAGGASECPLHRAGAASARRIDPEWENPAGVPISAFIFGGRRADHRAAGVSGVRLGARRLHGRHDRLRDHAPLPPGAVGEVRRDPFAMLPFCGYHIGDYFQHWLADGPRSPQAAARSSA